MDAIFLMASILISLRLPALAILALGLLVLVLKAKPNTFKTLAGAEH
jgi:hypothetical protein